MTDNRAAPLNVPDLRAGLRVSQISLVWTVAAGVFAIVIGVTSNSLVLVAFGAIGLLDGIGSGSLIVHFRHSLRHEAISQEHERIALTIVTVGMGVIGVLTIADSAYRLGTGSTSHSGPIGSALAGTSIIVLAWLALSKRRIAKRIPSHALHSDGWVSAMGSLLALVALAGLALDAITGAWWIDPIAAIGVACGAVWLSFVLARGRT